VGVTKGSPANRVGLKPGDVIVKLGKAKSRASTISTSRLRKFKVGDQVPVTVKRRRNRCRRHRDARTSPFAVASSDHGRLGSETGASVEPRMTGSEMEPRKTRMTRK
jgi:predicted metalloprotease with PDZ domain